MAFRDEEIRESFQGVAVTRDVYDPNRGYFTRISRRPRPDFTRNDPQLRLVVAQTAYRRYHRGGYWSRIPDELVNNPGALRASLKARLRKFGDEVLRAGVKDYIAALSVIAYLKWRVGYQAQDIAEYLQVPEQSVWYMAFMLRENATRLGLKFPRQKTWRGPKKYLSPEERRRCLSDGVKANWADPDVRERRVKTLHSPEYRARKSEIMKAAWARKKAVAVNRSQ